MGPFIKNIICFETCRELMQSGAEILFPSRCLICGEIQTTPSKSIKICLKCLKKIHLFDGPVCTCCGRLFQKAAGSNHLCGKCLTGRWFFEKARGLVLYEKPVSDIIHKFKYHGHTVALQTFKRIFNETIKTKEFKEQDTVF